MPLIQVTAQAGALRKDKQDALISRISDAVLRSEGASPSDPAAQALVWAHYKEVPTGSSYVGGKSPERAPLHIAVTTPEGSLDEAARETLAGDIGAIVDDLFGTLESGPNHWAMLYELADGNWSGGGKIVHLDDIKAAMNIAV
jgi:phenylpyruvate tautomerase PptA (4-oxalocrotonate tautomerase family)